MDNLRFILHIISVPLVVIGLFVLLSSYIVMPVGEDEANGETSIEALPPVEAIEETPRVPPSPPPTAATPAPTPMATPEPTPEETPSLPRLSDMPVENLLKLNPELAAQLDELSKKYNCVGVSLAAFDPDRGYITYQYGLADIAEERAVVEETRFRVASLAKVAGAIIVMSLVDDGQLDLDEDISTYLGYTVRNPSYPDDPITSRMLLQHTSSICDTGGINSGAIIFDENTTQNLLGRSSAFRAQKPGEKYEYTNLGYAVLGAICESVSGKLFDELARDLLFDPLGIDAAFVPSNLKSQNVASQYDMSRALKRSAQVQLQAESYIHTHQSSIIGNLTITALDYVKILNLLTHNGAYDDARVLSDRSVEEMNRANFPVSSGYMQGLAVRLAEGAFFGEDLYYHPGSAYGTLAQFFYSLEDKRIAVIVTTGSSSGRGALGDINVSRALSEFVWQEGVVFP